MNEEIETITNKGRGVTGAKVDCINGLHARMNELRVLLLAWLMPFDGQQVVTGKGEWFAKVKAKRPDYERKSFQWWMRMPDSKGWEWTHSIYVECRQSVGYENYNVPHCENGMFSKECSFCVGSTKQGVLSVAGGSDVRRTDFTVELVEDCMRMAEEHKTAVRELEGIVHPFIKV